jgi:hypothetical protein
LILLFSWWQPIGGEVWHITNPIAVVAVRALFGFGWALVLVADVPDQPLRPVRAAPGLAPISKANRTPRFRSPHRVRTGWFRHPLYVGWFFAFWMTPTMTVAHLVFALATTAYILLAIQFEKRDLVVFHGRAYEDYRRRVPMLIPFRRAGARHPAATRSCTYT